RWALPDGLGSRVPWDPERVRANGTRLTTPGQLRWATEAARRTRGADGPVVLGGEQECGAGPWVLGWPVWSPARSRARARPSGRTNRLAFSHAEGCGYRLLHPVVQGRGV